MIVHGHREFSELRNMPIANQTKNNLLHETPYETITNKTKISVRKSLVET